MLEAIDPLELSVQVANANMNKATEQMAIVGSISGTTAEVNAHARTIQGLAWQLLAANDVGSVDQTRQQITTQDEQAQQGLALMAKSLADLQRKSDAAAVHEAALTFQRVRERLIGGSGIAMVVRQSLEQQAKAEELFSSALQSIGQIAESGSERARDAESAQADAVGRIHRLSNATIVVVVLVGLVVLATGSFVGRIQKSLLAAEARQLAANEEMRRLVDTVSTAEANQRQANEHMRRLVETTRENTQTLRGASQDLTSSCEAATVSIESAAGGAQAMQSSILDISSSVTQAAEVGSEAGRLIQEASQAFRSLNDASQEITRVTDMDPADLLQNAAAGAQRDYRSSTRRGCRSRLWRGRRRGEGAGAAGGLCRGRDRFADRGHATGSGESSQGLRPDQGLYRADWRDATLDSTSSCAANCDHAEDRGEHSANGGTVQRIHVSRRHSGHGTVAFGHGRGAGQSLPAARKRLGPSSGTPLVATRSFK